MPLYGVILAYIFLNESLTLSHGIAGTLIAAGLFCTKATQQCNGIQVRVNVAHASLKWSTFPDNELALWVADMDCRPLPALESFPSNRARNLGYGIEPPGFRDAWVEHLQIRHQWSIDPDWIVPVAGVVPGMRFALMAHPNINIYSHPRLPIRILDGAVSGEANSTPDFTQP